MLALTAAFIAAYPVNRYLLSRGKGHALTHHYMHDAQPADWRRFIPSLGSGALAAVIVAFMLGGLVVAATSGLDTGGGHAAAPEDSRTVAVTMTDSLTFEPGEISVAPGETVRFVVTNAGEAVHEFLIEAEFGFEVGVVLRDRDEMTSLTKAIPAAWKEDASTRCYVMFLWDAVDDASVLDSLIVKEGIDDVKYLPGTVVWRVARDVLTRSGMMRLPSQALYQQMTIRNVNTVRKLADLMRHG
jgi:uncharacterized protein (DUF1697 family)